MACAVRLRAVTAPNPLHPTHTDALQFGHGKTGPMRRLARRRIAERHGYDPRFSLRAERGNARSTGLVAQQARDSLRG